LEVITNSKTKIKMSKLINEMKTHEIMKYLKKERFVHGLFYVDRNVIEDRYEIEILEKDWLGFANFFTEGFNRRNNFLFEGEDEVIEDWKEDKYQYGSLIINDPEKFS
jgi:hypothetical protein